MATTKTDLRKLGGWLHAVTHLGAALLVFPVGWAIALAVAHLLIDTRLPLVWWGKLFRQSTPEQAGAAYVPFAMGRDQAAHLLTIAIAAWWAGYPR